MITLMCGIKNLSNTSQMILSHILKTTKKMLQNSITDFCMFLKCSFLILSTKISMAFKVFVFETFHIYYKL